MPSRTVTITWDQPDEENWLCNYNIEAALGQVCKNTKFTVVDAPKEAIPPPPDDGKEYACVWVEVQRDAEGKRTCNGCKLFGECDKAEVIMTVYKHDDPHYFAPGPDCPLGSD